MRNPSDLDHLMDLLELLPWEPTTDDDSPPWRLDCPPLWAALDSDRTSLLANGILDYNRCRGGSSNNVQVSSRLSMYLIDVFEDAAPAVIEAVGQVVGLSMGLDAPAAAIGRRWCEDLIATAWRIRVPHMARAIRPGRDGA